MTSANQPPAELTPDGLDFGPVYKLLIRDGMPADQAGRAIADYKAFLHRVKFDGYRGSPGRLADKAWHAHILQTRKYVADCQALLGEYLHHTPTLELDDPDELRDDELGSCSCDCASDCDCGDWGGDDDCDCGFEDGLCSCDD